MLGPFKSGQPLSDRERQAEQPTLERAFARIDATIVRKRYRRGFRQGYASRATAETTRVTRRLQGMRDDD